MTSPTPLQFAPFSSSITPAFWQELTRLKLHVLQLSDAPVDVYASYGKGRTVQDRLTGQNVALTRALELDASGLRTKSPPSQTSADNVVLSGRLRNLNTIEEFKNSDKAAMLDQLGEEPMLSLCRSQIWQRMTSGGVAPTESELNPFLMITFADLKKYRYYYWCAFPALLQKPAWEVSGDWEDLPLDQFTNDAFVCISKLDLSALESASFQLAKAIEGQEGHTLAPISQATEFFEGVFPNERKLIFTDPSSHPNAVGWPVRNVLTYLARAHHITSIRLISVRESSLRTVLISIPAPVPSTRPSVIGWEKNDKMKLAPRVADLAPLMDPTKLADQAVDLNLQLMRWRILPALDLDKIKHTKVLLLGAGTLGCYVARTLMAWGVRKITLVDSSTVSFSNPVRQPLFEFEDSLNGGKPKAQAAADSLKRIYPGVDATGVSLSIPMPGHPIPPALQEQSKKDVAVLEQLIDGHDVVYLLMDSRESRWLPTLIGASKQKLVMNVALGFDTFLVMRHGVPSFRPPFEPAAPAQPGQPYRGQLGCYYCNDIVAPMDSLTDRTLDQMCTVTRPGIASIASATAVELMVSLLQHPQSARAPSDVCVPANATTTAVPGEDGGEGSCLGVVPHQIRGYLSRFENLKITGQAYDKCTGCSRHVIEAYGKEGFAMLVQAFEDAKYLERLTGLDKIEEETERMMEGMEEWDEEVEPEI
ncbi:BZ3500_MvSof-1268-A1-R1_Chr7-3g09644 [Microbotryum saponariae]|uniref:Ubiquitin-like modifier-activating enzyme ATG7 n=1 Tax=Microbotryum saponariae TaxID=289078 RepID=A0A2X0KXV2_9BASI|nr:BZ3501_MvSof-1269-A2-R1_Chr7-2g09367 [Microbotryum saponariae]SDA02337.1 BZ3500_MvSof-1268-A1-R1_Chr7-3g09644 [Microbotryum saponariae]